jgi:hypothetical protein
MFSKKGMKHLAPANVKKLLLNGVAIVFASFMVVALGGTGTVLAEEMAQDDELQFGLEIYGWGASIGGETATGSDVNLDFDDILDNLNFTAMGVVGIRKGKWSFTTDILYMDLEGDKDSVIPISGGTIGVNTDLELRAWVITPAVGYNVVETDNVSLNVIGGARYLSLDADIEQNINTPLRPLYGKVSDSASIWDGIVGVRGKYAFNEQWYVPYYLDIGTGDSDFTWQVSAGLGYKFKVCDVILAYRYLSWDFDDDSALDSMNISGPMLGVKFEF